MTPVRCKRACCRTAIYIEAVDLRPCHKPAAFLNGFVPKLIIERIRTTRNIYTQAHTHRGRIHAAGIVLPEQNRPRARRVRKSVQILHILMAITESTFLGLAWVVPRMYRM